MNQRGKETEIGETSNSWGRNVRGEKNRGRECNAAVGMFCDGLVFYWIQNRTICRELNGASSFSGAVAVQVVNFGQGQNLGGGHKPRKESMVERETQREGRTSLAWISLRAGVQQQLPSSPYYLGRDLRQGRYLLGK